MLNFKGMRFPVEVILVCIRWYAAYPLRSRHLEEMMEERVFKKMVRLEATRGKASSSTCYFCR